MEKKGNGNRAKWIIVAVLILAAVVFFAYRGGILSTEKKKIEVKVEVPTSPKLQPPTPLTLPTPDSAPSEPAPSNPKGP